MFCSTVQVVASVSNYLCIIVCTSSPCRYLIQIVFSRGDGFVYTVYLYTMDVYLVIFSVMLCGVCSRKYDGTGLWKLNMASDIPARDDPEIHMNVVCILHIYILKPHTLKTS